MLEELSGPMGEKAKPVPTLWEASEVSVFVLEHNLFAEYALTEDYAYVLARVMLANRGNA